MKHLQRLYTAIIFIFLYAPIVVMIVFSFNSTRYRTANFEEFTLKWYEELFKNETIMNSLFLTLTVAVLAAVVATVIGTMAAVGMYSMNKRMRAILMTANNIPMVNPEIVTGVSMLLLFVFIYEKTGLFQPGFLTLLLSHITFCIPYVILSVLPKLRQMNPNIYEAAMDLGCTPMQSFFKVVLPEITPGIVTGAIMAFTLSLDDFVISYFTGGSQAQTLPVTIYSMTKKNVKPTVFALSTLLFAAVFILLLAINVGQIAGANKKSKNN